MPEKKPILFISPFLVFFARRTGSNAKRKSTGRAFRILPYDTVYHNPQTGELQDCKHFDVLAKKA
ncbi:MAG: hypothetical protein RR215_06230, partial [Ruthenibacterium sp.]